ncbi:MAG: hypothetical protein K2X03_05885 [Bryobacteraceae bacterium]|nr:hypothetical protein [Bryobacteraceae bacterium]
MVDTDTTVRSGEIFRIGPNQNFYFADPVLRESFCCPFDKIRGYTGQSPEAFGLLPGTAVHFALDESGDVAWVELQ